MKKNFLLLIMLAFLTNIYAQTPEYCQEFDEFSRNPQVFSENVYPNWIGVTGKATDWYTPTGSTPYLGGAAQLEIDYGRSSCTSRAHAVDGIAYKIPGKFIKGRKYKVSYKIMNGLHPFDPQLSGVVEWYLVNGLSNAVSQRNSCTGVTPSIATTLNVPFFSDLVSGFTLGYGDTQEETISFTPTRDYDYIWLRCQLDDAEIADLGKTHATSTTQLRLDYFKILCGNERYNNVVGELVDENGVAKNTFCMGEKVCFDGTANQDYVRYRYAWAEKNSNGVATNYASSQIFDGPITEPFCLQDYDWQTTVDPWSGGFCPDRIYSFTLSLINECGCWTNVEFPFKIDCCKNLFDPTFELKGVGNGTKVTITNEPIRTYESSTDCPITNTWCIYQSDDVNGEYTPVTSFDGDSFTFEGDKGTFYRVVRRLSTPCGDFCSAQRVFFAIGIKGSVASEGGLVSQIIDCPDDCIAPSGCTAPEGLCIETSASGSTFSWDEIPGATSYTMNFFFNDPNCCDNGKDPFNDSFPVSQNSFTTPVDLSLYCFSWSITVECANGESATSSSQCKDDPCISGCTDCDVSLSDFTLRGFKGSCFVMASFPKPTSETCDLRTQIDWGDGTAQNIPSQFIFHNYNFSGTYTVCLNIIGTTADGEECILSICKSITVNCNEKTIGDGIDIEGLISRSEGSMDSDFTVSPNPASAEINLSLSGDWGDQIQMDIRDIRGKSFMNSALKMTTESGVSTVNLSELSPGMYIINLSDELGNYKIQKFIKI